MRFRPILSLLLAASALTAAAHAPAAPAPAAPAPAADKAYPAQADVADAKAAFATVAASDKAVAQALDAKALAGAFRLVGKRGAFQGTVSQVYSPRTHSVAILDFAPNYHAALTAAVKPDAYANFPNLSHLVGKRILISGRFSANSHGVAQIDLTSPDQVKVVR